MLRNAQDYSNKEGVGYFIVQFVIPPQKGKFGLFGHKRTKSEPETDGLICPPDVNGLFHKVNGKNGKVRGKSVISSCWFIL